MKWLKGGARFLLVSIGIIVLTSIGIDATQYFEGSGSALSILTREALQDSCAPGTVEVSVAGGAVCVDAYEASVGESCSRTDIRSIADTGQNVNEVACVPVTVAGATPWNFVSYHQAAALCAKADKRLASHEEWYRSALGTPDTPYDCNTEGSLEKTGSSPTCQSPKGTYDAIGNVWEWIAGEGGDQQFAGRQLPSEGYVVDADTDGIALRTAADITPGFNRDYFWSTPTGSFVTMRGGFYGGGEDAGLFSIHAGITPAFSGEAIGFRCAYDLF